MERADVVVPDRPYSEAELERHRSREQRSERTRSYEVRTSSRRLRGPEPGPKRGVRILLIGESVAHE